MRPSVFEYLDIPTYLQAMLSWHKATDPRFSVRREAAIEQRCSPALVTRVLGGSRKLTVERVSAFSRIFRLTSEERSYLERWVRLQHAPVATDEAQRRGLHNHAAGKELDLRPTKRRKAGQNHVLSDWLNVYVKDACRLKGFRPDPLVIHRLLGGIASSLRIERALRFLLREGFLRRTLDGRIVEADTVVSTTDEIPDTKIQAFHLQALEIAKRGIKAHSVEKRRAWAMILPLNEASVKELKTLLNEFNERLTVFAEDHPHDDEQLYQVVMNLCPIGGQSDEAR